MRPTHHVGRRGFLKWMGIGASWATINLSSCRRIEKYLIPWNQGPEWSLPGVETSYATCLSEGGYAVPIFAVCYEGRPVKLIPSQIYPYHSGLQAAQQASLFDLYHPQRIRHGLFQKKQVSEAEFRGAFASWSALAKEGGRIGIVLPSLRSPILHELCRELRTVNPRVRVFLHSEDSSCFELMRRQLPQGTDFFIDWSQVCRILTLGCDFLTSSVVGNLREFSEAHSPIEFHSASGKTPRCRLYAAEGNLSVTGAHADYRIAVKPSLQERFLTRLVYHLRQRVGVHDGSDNLSTLALDEATEHWIHECADELFRFPGKSIILIDRSDDRQAALAWEANALLNSIGDCIRLVEANQIFPTESLPEFMCSLRRRGFDMVLLANTDNPVFSLSDGNELGSLLSETESISLQLYENETSQSCRWSLPATHPLESWGVERDECGRYCWRQPVVLPLYGGISPEEFLLGLLSPDGKLKTADTEADHLSPVYHRVRQCFFDLGISDQAKAWEESLKQGFAEETMASPLSMEATDEIIRYLKQPKTNLRPQKSTSEYELEVQFLPSKSIDGGRLKRNDWMQEMPDFINGVSWAASAQISPNTFRKLGGDTEPARCTITKGKASVSLLLCPIPGVADDLISIPLGYGGITPEAPDQDVSDAYPLKRTLESESHFFASIPTNAITLHAIPKQTDAIVLPLLQDIPLITKSPPRKQGELYDLPKKESPYHWKMAIDTARCIGCNACLLACRAENNIPIVGKEQMARQRNMDWIRIDRYFSSSGRMTVLPVACQQCTDAPCESVCPVNATVHTSDGLNAMVYARCWGTRYCAANCPYQVRRFNFFDYAQASERQSRLQRNPHVTVRQRGVMEKCTYCVQMIEQAKIRHTELLMKCRDHEFSTDIHISDQDLLMRDGEVKTACQMACPTGAILFGNSLDPHAEITQVIKLERFTTLLPDEGTHPSTGYLLPIDPDSD